MCVVSDDRGRNEVAHLPPTPGTAIDMYVLHPQDNGVQIVHDWHTGLVSKGSTMDAV